MKDTFVNKRLMKQIDNNQGSALVTVLIMITILSILIMSLMSFISVRYRFIKRDINRMQALYLAEAGIHKTMWYLAGHQGKDKYWLATNYSLNLFDDSASQISISEWGGFLEIASTALYKGESAIVQALIGEKMPRMFNQAVIIGEVEYPLVVTGSNKIAGDVTVGSGGVKPGQIKGIRFSGDKLVDGDIKVQSPPQMPYFDGSLLEASIQKYQNMLTNPDGEIFDTDQIFDTENPLNFIDNTLFYVYGSVTLRSNSMFESLKIEGSGTLIATGSIILKNAVKFTQRIRLIAGEQITTSGDIEVKDGIFFAENGIFANGNLTGVVQIFSPGNIQLSGNVQLTYPSVLFVNGKVFEDRIEGKIEILDNSSVEGTIIFHHQKNLINNSLRNNGLITIDKNAVVYGAIYSSNDATITGKVYGIVITGKFFFYEEPTNYINWLKDATIDRNKLTNKFLLPLSFAPDPEFEILRCETVQ